MSNKSVITLSNLFDVYKDMLNMFDPQGCRAIDEAVKKGKKVERFELVLDVDGEDRINYHVDGALVTYVAGGILQWSRNLREAVGEDLEAHKRYLLSLF